MTPADLEVNYPTGEQNLHAVVHSIRTWRCSSERAEVTVVIYHNPSDISPDSTSTV